VARRLILACELGVGEALAADLRHSQSETLAIVHIFAVVETECLLIKVTEEMKRLHANVGSRNPALEKRPEILKAVRMDAPVNILNGMVHDLMRVIRCQSFVGEQGVGVESRASFYMLANLRLQLMLLAIRYDCGAYSSTTLKDSHNGSLVLGACASDAALALRDVHVSRFAADERFVYFDFAATATEFGAKEIILDSKAKTLQHEPCGLLCDSQSAVNLHAANTVLAIDQQPESGHPLVESKRRILKNRSQFQSELFFAVVAKPDAASLDERVFSAIAARANNFAIRPAEFLCILESAVRIGEVNDGFLESVWRVHEVNYSLKSHMCQGYNCPKKASLPDPLYVIVRKCFLLWTSADSISRRTIPWIRSDGTRENTQLPKLSIMNLLEQRTLGLGKFHRCRAFCVVIGDMVDPGADGIAPHGPSVARLQHL